MMQVNPYLNFNGNTREAMNFYKDCLGGELSIQVVKETPAAANMPPESQDKVMHSSLTVDGNILVLASDMMRDKTNNGNSISLCLNCGSEEEIRRTFKNLSQSGTIGHDLEDTFWGAIFGDLTDKYGIRWMFNYTKPGGQQP